MPVLLEKGVNTRNSPVPGVLQILQRQTPEKKKSPHFVTSQFYSNASMNISGDEFTEITQTSGLWQETF